MTLLKSRTDYDNRQLLMSAQMTPPQLLTHWYGFLHLRSSASLMYVPPFQINDNGEQCTYPAGSTPACTADDPCGFTCDNGFTASPAGNPTECVCVAPATICNGVCTTDACPSAGVTPPTRRGYMNSLRKRAMCPAGTTACGVYERRGARSSPFECIHTDSDLESCELSV